MIWLADGECIDVGPRVLENTQRIMEGCDWCSQTYGEGNVMPLRLPASHRSIFAECIGFSKYFSHHTLLPAESGNWGLSMKFAAVQ